MKAMILAAGLGTRMRPLTETIPKPLLKVGEHTLIEHHLLSLAKNGIVDVVINVSHHADQIQQALGNGNNFGINIHYSVEPPPTPLETAGGIIKALPLLGQDPFIVINADVWTDFPLQRLQKPLAGLAHLVLIDNPAHNLRGDYGLENSYVTFSSPLLTLSGIGVYHPQLFANLEVAPLRLPALLAPAINAGQVTGEHYEGRWIDVGTPERLLFAKELAMKQSGSEFHRSGS